MNEGFRIRFTRLNQKWPITQLDQEQGITFEGEEDDQPRNLALEFDGDSPVTRLRMSWVRERFGWVAGQFNLKVRLDDGELQVSGEDETALPAGRYWVQVHASELQIPKAYTSFELKEGQTDAIVSVPVQPDPRRVELTRPLTQFDPAIRTVLVDSGDLLNDMSVADWLAADSVRACRKACLLNLMAKLRVPPRAGMPPLLGGILRVFFAASERIYVEAATDLYDACDQLAAEPSRRFYLEGHPTSPTHKRLLAKVAEMGWGPFTEDGLVSFRQEGQPSTQVVVATNVPLAAPLYADIDLDLGNPLQDLAGFVVHMGELISGKSTDHLKLWSKLNKGATKEFLYYRVV